MTAQVLPKGVHESFSVTVKHHLVLQINKIPLINI
jgi:hypothetical protein